MMAENMAVATSGIAARCALSLSQSGVQGCRAREDGSAILGRVKDVNYREKKNPQEKLEPPCTWP